VDEPALGVISQPLTMTRKPLVPRTLLGAVLKKCAEEEGDRSTGSIAAMAAIVGVEYQAMLRLIRGTHEPTASTMILVARYLEIGLMETYEMLETSEIAGRNVSRVNTER